MTLPGRHLPRQGLVQLIETEQQRAAQHQRAQRRAIEQAVLAAVQFAEKRQRRAHLQQQGKCPGEQALLAQTQPENPRAFHRPCRRSSSAHPAPTESPGWRKSRPGPGRFLANSSARPPISHPARPHVNHAQRQGAECGSELQMLHQRELQAEARQRRTEQQSCRRRNHPCAPTSAAAPRDCRPAGASPISINLRRANSRPMARYIRKNKIRNGSVLHNSSGVVGAQAPGESDAEGAGEADDIQQAPGR